MDIITNSKMEKRKKGVDVFKTHQKDVTNGITTKIQSYVPNGYRSFTIDITSHVSYNGTDNGMERLVALNKLLGLKVETYSSKSIWDFIIIDMDYPDTAFRSGSSFVHIQITAARRIQVLDYNAVVDELIDLRDYVVGFINKEEFTFSETKRKKLLTI